MWSKIQERIFPFIIALSALSVSASAAFYSVSGLSKLFAGASLQVIIMAGSLEVAKLVIASLLYQYWDKLNKVLRVYLSIATVVLILITSMGIYGFLSAAYQETANKAGNVDAQVTLVETKRDNVKEQLNVYTTEKESINKSVTDLRAGLANNVIQYTNSEGQLITTTSSATRKALEKQLDQAIERQTNINTKVDELNTQLFDYETEIVDISTNSELAGELGPLKYLSNLTGVSMDRIINWLLLVIIFVFDPLAISLVVAANFAFAQLRPKKDDVSHLNPQVEPENLDTEHKVEVKDLPEENTIYLEGEELRTDFPNSLNEIVDDLPEEVIDEILEGEVFEVSKEDWKIIDEEPQIEVKMSGEPSLNMLSEEESKFDLNNDGILDDLERTHYEEYKLLNTPGISAWRKKKIRDYLEGKAKKYW